MMHAIDRRKALTVVAAAPAAAALGGSAIAQGDGDAELRRLWAEYLQVLDAIDAAERAYKPAREAYDKEWVSLRDEVLNGDPTNVGEVYGVLWEKHSMEAVWRPMDRLWKKQRKDSQGRPKGAGANPIRRWRQVERGGES